MLYACCTSNFLNTLRNALQKDKTKARELDPVRHDFTRLAGNHPIRLGGPALLSSPRKAAKNRWDSMIIPDWSPRIRIGDCRVDVSWRNWMERAELLAFINHIWPPVLALHRWSVAEWGLAVDRVVVLKLNFRSSSGTSLLVSRGMGQV